MYQMPQERIQAWIIRIIKHVKEVTAGFISQEFSDAIGPGPSVDYGQPISPLVAYKTWT
jgi:hypothetical protein